MSSIWTDDYLNQLVGDAHFDITDRVPCIFDRFFLEITENVNVYTLPDFVRSIRRVTVRGKKLEAVSWPEMEILQLQSAYVSETVQFQSSSGRPQFYALHPTNIRNITFYPRPSESYDTTGDPFSPFVNEPKCTISCMRIPDVSQSRLDFPSYIGRRIVKAYVLTKAFAQEGKGQDLNASAYYLKKYNYLIKSFSSILDSVFLAKRYQLGPDIGLAPLGKRPGKPTLPSNYERVHYK